jgi:DNA-binding CsgD family transcriptional regulator
LALLPIALRQLAVLHTLAGRFDDAEAAIQEADGISGAIGEPPAAYGHVVLAAWRGRLPETTALVENAARDATARGEGLAMTAASHAVSIQHIGLSHYEEALEAALKASGSEGAMYAVGPLPDVIEAAVRSNKPDVAATAFKRLSTIAQAMRTEWALGVEARSRALLSDAPDEAERLYRQAIERLDRSILVTDLARAHLLYGEWLRRERRRTDARDQLRTAHGMFGAMGAEAFADRAARELHATGERARRRSPETTTQLTPQQAQVARLASEGHTNTEIGAQLFISPRTVEYHLRNVFNTLGISSRAHLARALD